MISGVAATVMTLAAHSSAQAFHPDPQVLMNCDIYARHYASVAARVNFRAWQCAYDYGYRICVAGWGPAHAGAAGVARASLLATRGSPPCPSLDVVGGGAPYGNRTRLSSVKGWRPDR